MSFINVKLERRFSEKSVFLAEIANEQTCIFESQIFIGLSFQSGFKIVRLSVILTHTVILISRHCRLIFFQSLL